MKDYNRKKRGWLMRLLFGDNRNQYDEAEDNPTCADERYYMRRQMNRDTSDYDRYQNNEKKRRRGQHG
jgi:hypothetical protein